MVSHSFRGRLARLTIAAAFVTLGGLGAAAALPGQPALAVCQPCHVANVPTPTEASGSHNLSDYDDIGRDQHGQDEDGCLDYGQLMCVPPDDGDGADSEPNMCVAPDMSAGTPVADDGADMCGVN